MKTKKMNLLSLSVFIGLMFCSAAHAGQTYLLNGGQSMLLPDGSQVVCRGGHSFTYEHADFADKSNDELLKAGENGMGICRIITWMDSNTGQYPCRLEVNGKDVSGIVTEAQSVDILRTELRRGRCEFPYRHHE